LPGVVVLCVLCFYACMALDSWQARHKEFAARRHLLDAAQDGQRGQEGQEGQRMQRGHGVQIEQKKLALAVSGRAGADAMNSTAGAYGKLKGVFEVLSLRAEQMLEAVFALGCVTMLASVCITLSLCGRADRASELRAPLQPVDE
jgi:hypothetical protein